MSTTDLLAHRSAGDLSAFADARIARVRALRDRIVHAPSPRSAENTVVPFTEMEMEMDVGTNLFELFESVHPDPAMRESAELCHQELSRLDSELELDRELFEAVSALEPLADGLDADTARFVRHAVRDFRRAGVDKDDAARARIKALHEELVLLAQEFNRNIRGDTRSIALDGPADLAGLPADYVAAHPPDADGKIRITTDYPDFVPFMSYAARAEHRRRLFFEYSNRAFPGNEAVLLQILSKRHELARLLGHVSFASFAAEDKMIRRAERIAAFIDEIDAIAKPRSARDFAILLERKRRDEPDAAAVEEWEKSYLSELVRAETLGFDSQEIRPYLGYDRVKRGVLEATQQIFAIEYRKVEAPVWHASVETYDVFEKGARIGRFHLDMHPREGKYKHAAMFPIASGVRGILLPEAALVCNFPDPSTANGPALLEHSDVVTFFHELGHLLHHILGGGQTYSRFSGVATEWDFVEVPSQLLEEWAYSAEALGRLAVHAETGAPIPREMIARMNRARSFGRGIRVCQQMFYAALSLALHHRDPSGTDTTAVLRELQARYSPYPYVEGTHMQVSFGHLEGYSALYYTYMWSLVIARDFFDRFSEKGLFDTDCAVAYRRTVLEPGGSRDAADLVRAFLGRDYDLAAYRRWVEA